MAKTTFCIQKVKFVRRVIIVQLKPKITFQMRVLMDITTLLTVAVELAAVTSAQKARCVRALPL
jgi:hypothetical protein